MQIRSFVLQPDDSVGALLGSADYIQAQLDALGRSAVRCEVRMHDDRLLDEFVVIEDHDGSLDTDRFGVAVEGGALIVTVASTGQLVIAYSPAGWMTIKSGLIDTERERARTPSVRPDA